MKVSAVILAGGEGSRIGGSKPLRMLGGETLLDRAIRQAESWSDSVAVAVRNENQIGGAGLQVVQDDPAIAGPLAGLIAALRFGRNEDAGAVLTIPTDMPFLPDDLALRFAREMRGRCAALASSGGHLHPVCGLWLTSGLDSVPDYLASGRRSLRGFAESIGFAAVEWPSDPVDPFFNINSPEDLVEAERLLRP